MKGLHERAERLQAERIADLEDEAASLKRQKHSLELEVNALRRDLRRARRNLGYRFANGINRALKPLGRLLSGNGDSCAARFPAVAHNGKSAPPCSTELRKWFATLGDAVQAVFFTSATERNHEMHECLSHTRPRQWCFNEKELKAAIATSFFAIPKQRVTRIGEPPAFAQQDLIVIDGSEPGLLWPLLKGRFWPHQKLIFHGRSLRLEFPPTCTGPDFAFYAAPPAGWLDPRSAYEPAFAPWKSSRRQLSARLPSGNPWPKISVVTPSFNQGKFIAETFESIFEQHYPNLEYLVLDGGSTDETAEIMDHYSARFSYSCSQKDNGQADAINKGFARATGDILAWLNSDDQYPAASLMHVALAFDLFPEADVVVGACGLVQATGSIPSRIHHSALPVGKAVPLPLGQLLDLDNCWLKGHFFYQPEVFWRRRIWDAVGARVSDDLHYCFDYDLWVRMAEAGARVVHIPDLLALYRVHPAQKTYGDNLPYLPELKLVKSRRGGAAACHDIAAKT